MDISRRLKHGAVIIGVTTALIGTAGRASAITEIDIENPPDATANLTSWSDGINDAGQAVVSANWNTSGPVNVSHTYRWTPGGGLQDVATSLGDVRTSGTDINSAGHVVGNLLEEDHTAAFLWTPGRGAHVLGEGLQANALSDRDDVTGSWQHDDGTRAFRWTTNGRLRDLGALGGMTSNGVAVNRIGQVAGYASTSTGTLHAFRWTGTRGMLDLGTLGAGGESQAVVINDRGWVAGFSTTPSDATHAFLWRPARGMQDLGVLPGPGNVYQVTDMNDRGMVVGRFIAGYYPIEDGHDPMWHAFRWTPWGGMRDLGVLGGDFLESEANAINEAGTVAGSTFTAGAALLRSFRWTPRGGMEILSDLDGVVSDINNHGQVTGQGQVGVSSYHAMIWP